MPDLTAPSASERLAEGSVRAVGGFRRLHFVTRIVVVAGLIHVLGDVLLAVSTLNRGWQAGQWPLDWMASLLGAFGFSLTFFGTAATVEFLFRIWREVKLLRKARGPSDA
jgi:hypothetical protein